MAETYVCPMHPEETSDKPGKCSKCGMALLSKDEIEHAEVEPSSHDHSDHHKMMAEDFKRRFFVTLPLTALILLLSPQIQLC